jgi:hypothetical protein
MRKWFSIISSFVFLLVILAIAGVWQFKRVLTSLQVESFHYQLERLNLHHVKFSEVSFVHKSETAQHTIHVHNLAADWQWQSWFSPQLGVVSVGQLDVVRAALSDVAKSPADTSKSIFSLPENWSVPESFPEQIKIQNLTIKLPCAAAYCTFAGMADAAKIKVGKFTAGINLKLKVSPHESVDAEHQLILDATYTAEKNLPMLDAALNIDNSVNLQLNTALKNQNEVYWIGNLKGYALNPDERWLGFLKIWGIQYIPQTLEKTSTEKESIAPNISIDAEWKLALTPLINLPKTANISDAIKALTGNWMLVAKIPKPLVLANFGEFSGDINLDLAISAGKLNRYALAADMALQNLIVPEALSLKGLGVDAAQLHIKSNMNSAVNLNSLPIEFSGSTRGAIQANLAGQLLVDTATKKITVEQLNLTAKAKQIKLTPEIQLDNIRADVHASGSWQPDKFELNLSVPNQVSADVLAKSLFITAKAAQISTSQLKVSGKVVQGAIVWPELKFTTEAQLKGGKFQHPQVNAKTWYWGGKAQGSLADFAVNGDLGVGSSLRITHQVQRKASALTLDWKMPDIFLLATNPFVDILAVWPPLLTLSRGKINANGNMIVNLEKNILTKSKTDVQFSDVSGIYDTLIFQGLSSQIKIITNDNKLDVSTDELSVNHINKGFDFGPLLASGKYRSTWEKLMQGNLDLHSFSGSAMGGSLSTAAQQFDFSKPIQSFKLELTDINLTTLLKQYSSNELSGTGLLSGFVPIEINRAGIRVAQGMIAAAEPGGLLQMNSTRAAAMAKNQPSMKLVVDALNNFHYTALASQINYDEKGKLFLSVKLEGRNPALENGRPIHLNVNLEEDVPAMLASIQLSSKVSDIVKKRLQSRVQKN